MNSKELALSIAKFLDSKKATDLEVIQIGELTTIGDYFVVATASNTTLSNRCARTWMNTWVARASSPSASRAAAPPSGS